MKKPSRAPEPQQLTFEFAAQPAPGATQMVGEVYDAADLVLDGLIRVSGAIHGLPGADPLGTIIR